MRPTKEELDNRFTYHGPKESQTLKYEVIRAKQRELADLIVDYCPESREASLALTKIEEVGFWANAAIARHS